MLAQLCKTSIKLYWFFIPKEKRIVCLYKDSCSRYVYRTFDERGLFAGLQALLYRYKNCKKSYSFYFDGDKLKIKTAAGQIIHESEANKLVVLGCKASSR